MDRQFFVTVTVLFALTAVAGTGFATNGGPPPAQVTETAVPTATATAAPGTATSTPIEAETPVGTSTATPAAPTNESFDVEGVTAPASAVVGDTVEVSANVSNPNDVESTQTVEFRVMGELINREELTLGPSETGEVSFTLNTTGARPGRYVHSVLTRGHGAVGILVLQSGNETETESPAASITFENQTATDSNVVVAEAVLPAGGYVVVHNETGAVVGASEYLAAGTHTDVNVTIEETIDGTATLTAMAHRDTDGNQAFEFVVSEGAVDGPYTVDDDPVTDEADVAFES